MGTRTATGTGALLASVLLALFSLQAGAADETALTSAQKAALDRENARYAAAVDACKKGPVSQRTTCISAAGRDHRLAGLE